MRYDANYYTKENFVDKFEKLLNYRYENIGESHRRTAFCEEYLEKFGCGPNGEDPIGPSLKHWFSFANKRLPSIGKLMNICELLDCDIDYFLTDQTEYKRDTAAAAEITGLEYKTIEILEKIKNSPQKNHRELIDKCILFLVDFLLQRIKGRYILWNLFQYLFKEYSFVREGDYSGSNTIELEDVSLIEERNVGLYVDEVSEQVFYSNITTGIVKLKEQENTLDFDTSKYEYTPTKESILSAITEQKNRIQELENRPETNFSSINPYTPEYALRLVHHDATNEWEEFPIIAKKVRERVALDIYNQEQIHMAAQHVDRLEHKLNVLYGEEET